jgi:hypothetical protein
VPEITAINGRSLELVNETNTDLLRAWAVATETLIAIAGPENMARLFIHATAQAAAWTQEDKGTVAQYASAGILNPTIFNTGFTASTRAAAQRTARGTTTGPPHPGT